MLNNRFIISGLIINSLAACSSSSMELSQPKGDWVDFESSSVRSVTTANIDNRTSPTPANQYGASGAYRPVITNNAGVADKERFVTGNGKNVPLYNAVRTIVPPSWSVKLSPDVSAKFRGTLSWVGNDQWPYVLRKSLSTAGLAPVIDESRREVIVGFAAPVKTNTPPLKPASALPLSQPATSDKKVSVTPVPVAPLIATPVKQPTEKKPLLVAPVLAVPRVTTPVKQLAEKKPLLIASVPDKPAVPVKPAVRIWKIEKGSSLREGFEKWASGERCPGPGGKWIVNWKTETNYPIDNLLSFTATDFSSATLQLFSLYETAQQPLAVTGYIPQCLIVIVNRK